MCLLPCSAFDYIAKEDPLPNTVSLGVLTTQVHLPWTIPSVPITCQYLVKLSRSSKQYLVHVSRSS